MADSWTSRFGDVSNDCFAIRLEFYVTRFYSADTRWHDTFACLKVLILSRIVKIKRDEYSIRIYIVILKLQLLKMFAIAIYIT